MTTKRFAELGLSTELLKAIDKLGFEQASPIQAEAIPVLMAGKDVVGQSQTGSGKTAAFAIPAIERVKPELRAVQVLILCPTRELAVQVSEEVHKLALFKRGITALPIYGGQSYERQFWGLKQGAQIVIGTPGRVMDHMRRGTLRLEQTGLVILDEADVMLNMGFRDDIETILKAAPAIRQTVFFSATMPKAIRELIEHHSREPINVKMEQRAMTVPTVEQVYYEVDRRYKVELLTRLIDIHDLKLGIIFCNTKRMVDELVEALEAQGYLADRLHGDMTQAMRDRVMQKFRKSGLEFLVATDIAARGIDVDDVQVVFNYDLPYDGEDYVHRIGRTGRAGRAGRAISFASGRELFQIRNIERYTNMRIQRAKIPTAEEVHEARESFFLDKLRATLAAGQYKRQDHIIERLLEEGFNSTDIASALIHHLQTDEAAAVRNVPREPATPPRPPTPAARPRREPQSYEASPRAESRPRERFGNDRGRSERPSAPPWKQKDQSQKGTGERPISSTTPMPGLMQPAKPAAPAAPTFVPSPQAPPAHVKEAPVKTFSDAEILDSVRASGPKTENAGGSAPKPAASAAKVRHSRATPTGQTRLWVGVGSEHGVKPIDMVNLVAGETGLPGKVVGTVDVREKHLFMDVSAEHAFAIISRLNRTQVLGRKIKAKVA